MTEPRTVLVEKSRARGERTVAVERITHFMADCKYVSAFYDGGVLLLDEALCDIEAEFGSRFVRTHRAYLVAKNSVRMLRRNLGTSTFSLVVAGVEGKLPVSRRGARTVRAAIPGVKSKVIAR
jgi:two-component system response regulator AlgR